MRKRFWPGPCGAPFCEAASLARRDLMGQSLCRCVGPPPSATGSRAARVIAGGDRMRAMLAWQDWHAENTRLLGKLRAAALAMANMPIKRGLNMWHDTCVAEREALAHQEASQKALFGAEASVVTASMAVASVPTSGPTRWSRGGIPRNYGGGDDDWRVYTMVR